METTEEAPVTCLGKTFESEETRREYFREELRKKLPELKQIDGFPIGDDEDIIELSDPPYYTACPNPWLDEIVNKWDDEKKRFLQQGKRFKDFSIDEPFSSDISEGKNNRVYMAHTFHTKVPHPAIMRYILHYTQPGDIILDGFAGTGMTGVACNRCANPRQKEKHKIENEWKNNFDESPDWGDRKCINGDLSPIATFISQNINSNNNRNVGKRAKEIISSLEKEMGWVYETKHSKNKVGTINYVVWSDIVICDNCLKELSFWNNAVDKNESSVNSYFECPHCGAELSKRKVDSAFETKYDSILERTIKTVKQEPVLINYKYDGSYYDKEPDKKDLETISSINDHSIKSWFPTERMTEGDEARRNDRRGLTHIHHFYTKRNLWVLSELYKRVKDYPGVHLVFTSIVQTLTSKLVRYNLGNRGNGPLSGTLYVSSLNAENNVFKVFRNKITSIEKALPQRRKNITYTGSATEINIKSNSIDYIFTDPPFGSNLMYSELSFIWESWLKIKTNNSLEAIENNSQNKGLPEYQKILTNCFKEYHRVLKPSAWITVEFSNTNASVWNCIQQAIQRAGLVISNITALDKKQGSFKAVTTPTAVKQDLVLSCYKPSKKLKRKFAENRTDIAIWDFVDEHLEHLPIHLIKDNSTTKVVERSPKILYDRLISFYVTRGLPVPIDSNDFQSELSQRYAERDGMYFTQKQVAKYDEKKSNTSDFIQLSLNVANENEGIEWLRAELQDNPQTYSEIHPKWMKATTAIRKGDILPELKTILEQNFIQKENGSWRVPNMNEAKDREALRTKGLLKEFEEYVNKITGQGAKKLKEARAEALRAGFKKCWDNKDFKTIVRVGEKIPESLLLEDDQLLMYYDIATDRV